MKINAAYKDVSTCPLHAHLSQLKVKLSSVCELNMLLTYHALQKSMINL